MAKYTNSKRARINGNGNGAASVGDNSEKAAPIKWSKSAQAAIDFAAQKQIDAAKMQMAVFAEHMKAYRADHTYLDDAKAILLAVREQIIEYYKKHPSYTERPPVPPMLKDTRISEWRKIVRIGDWKCADDVVAMFEHDKMTFDDCLAIANYLIKNVETRSAFKGDANKAKLVDAIKKAKAAKNGNKVTYNEKGTMVLEEKGPTKLSTSKASSIVARTSASFRAYVGGDKKYARIRSEVAKLCKEMLAKAIEIEALSKEVEKAAKA